MAKAKYDGHMAYYATVFTNWSVPLFGSMPTAEMCAMAHNVGCRPGKQALARALEFRPEGATDGVIKMVCAAQFGNSGPHNNKRTELEKAGLIKRMPTMHTAQNHMVYKIALTPKGEALVKARAAGMTSNTVTGPNSMGAKPAPVAKGKAPVKLPKGNDTVTGPKVLAKPRKPRAVKPATTPTPAVENAPAPAAEPMTAIAPVTVPAADQPQAS